MEGTTSRFHNASNVLLRLVSVHFHTTLFVELSNSSQYGWHQITTNTILQQSCFMFIYIFRFVNFDIVVYDDLILIWRSAMVFKYQSKFDKESCTKIMIPHTWTTVTVNCYLILSFKSPHSFITDHVTLVMKTRCRTGVCPCMYSTASLYNSRNQHSLQSRGIWQW